MDPGTALAVVSLTFQLFGACVKGFSLLSTAHNLGKDGSLLRTMLNFEEYHLVSWANKVGLTGPDAQLDPRLNQALAANLLRQLDLLLQTDKLRERYKLDLRAEPTVPLSGQGEEDSQHDSTSAQGVLANLVPDQTKLEILFNAKQIQSKNNFPKRLWWAVVDKSKFEALVQDIHGINQGLWSLLNSVQQEQVTFKVDQVLSNLIGISQDIQGLKELQSAALLGQSEDSAQVPTAAITAAGLKATRLELQDDDSSYYAASATFPSFPSRSRRSILLPSLSASELSEVAIKPSDSSIGTAMYANTPVLIEYKIVPSRLKSKLRSRVENLAVLLNAPKSPFFMTLHCLGFLEDDEHFVFVFEYPTSGLPPPTENGDPTKLAQPISLLDILRDSKQQPSVTARISLTLAIANTLLALHTAGWLHKELRSENILFFPVMAPPSCTTKVNYDLLSRPYLTHFAFSRASSPAEISEQPSSSPQHDIYRHPSALGEPSTSFNAHMDIYSLGTIMVEIAEWRALKVVVRRQVDVSKTNVNVPLAEIAKVPEWLMREKILTGALGFRMGDVFAQFAEACLRIDEGQKEASESLSMLRDGVRALGRCIV
ncbi:hypothetical protein MMC12_008035 [Toensbergia leucococca]|nr:hypothetical protein [Toensbergia leucococca]